MLFFLDVSYLGSNFSGSQKQPNAPSIQEELEKALATIIRTPIHLVAASRTDSGVHALQNIFQLDIDKKRIPSSFYIDAVNALLPASISVNDIYQVEESTHARFSATSRSYSYLVSQKRTPFLHHRAYLCKFVIQKNLLDQTAKIIEKKSDFASFSKKHSQTHTTNCRVTHAAWTYHEAWQLWEFSIRTNRFLRGMVRALVATQLEVARGKMSLEAFNKLFENPLIAKAKFAVPPQGLYLKEISYPFSNNRNQKTTQAADDSISRILTGLL